MTFRNQFLQIASTNSFSKASSPFLFQVTTTWLADFDDYILKQPCKGINVNSTMIIMLAKREQF